ncbi:MAG: hypothetical protein J6B80_02115 [Clostridia bacterium]|nr:hypothetical protein [Clostridia bacterium]
MKKILSIILALVLCFGMSACAKKQGGGSTNKGESAVASKKDTITLLYSTSDSFNPYESITDQNRQIAKLLFEPLVKTDNNFNTVLCIAESVKTEGAVCTVKLKNVTFSDSSLLTADDVVYSYKAAVAAKGLYAAKLYEVKTVSVADSKTVVFELKKSDPYFEKVLDFPVFKAGSDKLTDEDSVKLVPIGCGKYVFNDEKTELVQNPKYYGKLGDIKKIRLINAPDSESVAHYVEIGAADIYFNDISDGEIFRMSGQKYDINLNNLVYIGINHSVGDLSQALLRQAISTAIDRDAVCSEAYFNNALSAKGFYTPVWDAVKSVQNIQTYQNSEITIENLTEIGYNKLDNEGVRYRTNRSLRFSLLVNSENRSRVAAAELIAEQLKPLGIKLTVVKVSFQQYQKRLSNGEFQLYLGEVNITENMDISSLVVPGGLAAYGVKDTVHEVAEGETAPATVTDIVNSFYSGKAEITDVVSVLQTEMPIIPICYRTGVMFCDDNIKNVNGASQNDVFLNISSYKLK